MARTRRKLSTKLAEGDTHEAIEEWCRNMHIAWDATAKEEEEDIARFQRMEQGPPVPRVTRSASRQLQAPGNMNLLQGLMNHMGMGPPTESHEEPATGPCGNKDSGSAEGPVAGPSRKVKLEDQGLKRKKDVVPTPITGNKHCLKIAKPPKVFPVNECLTVKEKNLPSELRNLREGSWRVWKWKKTHARGRPALQPPISVGRVTEEEYYVERMIDARIAPNPASPSELGNDIEYQVKWWGWSAEFNSWVKDEDNYSDEAKLEYWAEEVERNKTRNTLASSDLYQQHEPQGCDAILDELFKS